MEVFLLTDPSPVLMQSNMQKNKDKIHAIISFMCSEQQVLGFLGYSSVKIGTGRLCKPI